MLVYHKVVLSISCGFPYSSFQTGHLGYHHHCHHCQHHYGHRHHYHNRPNFWFSHIIVCLIWISNISCFITYYWCELIEYNVVFLSQGKQICSIPIQLCSFSNLQKIILRGNQLTDISWSVIYLKQLKELDLSFNALVSTHLKKLFWFIYGLFISCSSS